MVIREVTEKREIVRGYRQLFGVVYADVWGWHDPPMPFHLARLDPRSEPIWREAERRLCFALEGDRAVGRLMAFVPPEELRRPAGSRTGRIALFDAVASGTAGHDLLEDACRWLEARGCNEVTGPFAFSMHDEVGLLVEGFEHPPAFMMPFNPPHAAAQLLAAGFVEIRKFWTYEWELARDQIPLPGTKRQAPAGLRVRGFSLPRREQETAGLLEVYNAAFAGNWGFEALTPEACRLFVDQFVRFGDPRLVRVAELEGRLVGFALTVPDPNQHLHRTRGQPGWLRLARLIAAVKLRRLHHARVITLAVRPELRRTGVTQAIMQDLAQTGRDLGYRFAELSYIDAGNEAMNRILTGHGFPRRKSYAVYRRAL